MKVSIIVPCYKVELYLPTCIESVQSQSYSDWELVLVDDGSPDRCGEICDKYAKTDERIKVIHKSNGGLSDARNAGLKVMTGDFVAFLDSDDFWHRDYLKLMMELQQQYDADIVQCKWTRGNQTVFPDVSITYSAICKSGSEAMAESLFDVMMWGKIYRRNMLDDIKMPVGLINEDVIVRKDSFPHRTSYITIHLTSEVFALRPLAFLILVSSEHLKRKINFSKSTKKMLVLYGI